MTTHPRVFRRPWPIDRSWAFLESVLAAPALSVLTPTQRHGAVLSEVLGTVAHLSGNIIHDTTTAVLMREHGIRTVMTRDTDFHRFPFIEVIDPLQD